MSEEWWVMSDENWVSKINDPNKALSTNIQILYHVFKSFPCAYDALRACLKVQPLQLHGINTDCQIPKRW